MKDRRTVGDALFETLAYLFDFFIVRLLVVIAFFVVFIGLFTANGWIMDFLFYKVPCFLIFALPIGAFICMGDFPKDK